MHHTPRWLILLLLAGALSQTVSAATPPRPPAKPAPKSGKPSGPSKVYRWTDENGQVHYGNTLPPSEVDRSSETLNASGRVIESRGAALTPEEREAEQAAKAAEAEQAKQNERLCLR